MKEENDIASNQILITKNNEKKRRKKTTSNKAYNSSVTVFTSSTGDSYISPKIISLSSQPHGILSPWRGLNDTARDVTRGNNIAHAFHALSLLSLSLSFVDSLFRFTLSLSPIPNSKP